MKQHTCNAKRLASALKPLQKLTQNCDNEIFYKIVLIQGNNTSIGRSNTYVQVNRQPELPRPIPWNSVELYRTIPIDVQVRKYVRAGIQHRVQVGMCVQ